MAKTIGDMRHRLVFQSATKTADTYGGFTSVWAEDFALWCSVRQISEAEALRNGQNAGLVNYSCYCLFQDGLIPTSQHRVLWGDKLLTISAPIRDDDGKHVWLSFTMSYKEAAAVANYAVIQHAHTSVGPDNWFYVIFSRKMVIPANIENLFRLNLNGDGFNIDSIIQGGDDYTYIFRSEIDMVPFDPEDILTLSTFTDTMYDVDGNELREFTDFPIVNNVIGT